MAQVMWSKKADNLFEKYVFNAFIEFGRSTSRKWMDERTKMSERLATHPLSYPPEPLLRGWKRCYRSCLILNRFKFVYHYSDQNDMVYVVDIWDTRMNPDSLKRRIK